MLENSPDAHELNWFSSKSSSLYFPYISSGRQVSGYPTRARWSHSNKWRTRAIQRLHSCHVACFFRKCCMINAWNLFYELIIWTCLQNIFYVHPVLNTVLYLLTNFKFAGLLSWIRGRFESFWIMQHHQFKFNHFIILFASSLIKLHVHLRVNYILVLYYLYNK